MSRVAPLRVTFAGLCRGTRLMLDITQQELADAVGVSRPYIASIESGRANPSLDVVERIAESLGLQLELRGQAPVTLNSPRQRDLVHARCSGYVDRRLAGTGWLTRREVTIVRGRMRGWIDLLAFDPRQRILLVVEIKTWLDDLGAVERQLDWYVHEAPALARRFAFRPIGTIGWLLVLATAEFDGAIRTNRDAIARRFPARARSMGRLLLPGDAIEPADGIALIDPRARRRNWLIPTQLDGRRSRLPYTGYADAARRLAS
jgi:transcriptional regulator with XRE-family HTH domain